MRLKETLQKKHVHTWKPVAPAALPFDAWGFEVETPPVTSISRVCSECGCEQTAHIVNAVLDGLPETLWHLADLDWQTSARP